MTTGVATTAVDRRSQQVLARLASESLARAFRRTPPSRRGSANDRAECLLSWAKRHLPEHFAKPASDLHRWIANELNNFTSQRGRKVNVIGPRGAAKSTVASLAYVLRVALNGNEPYIWLVSDTRDQARAHLENIKAELEDNPRIAKSYSNAAGCGPIWRSGRVELNNGVVIEAFGVGQHLRGRRRRADRPTLIVCDDLQNDSHATSPKRRESSRSWFHGALMKAGTPRTNVVNVATALHRDALALELHRTPGWQSRRFQAIEAWPTNVNLWDEWRRLYCDAENPRAAETAREFYRNNLPAMTAGARVLWPEHEDLYTLMVMRTESGEATFEREKQGSPVDPDRCEWPDSYFAEHAWFDDWPQELSLRTISLDPSKGGDSRHGDYSAIVMLGVDSSGVLYVEADLARRPTPQMVADGVTRFVDFKPDTFGVEANQWQQLLAGEFVAEFRRRGLLGVTPCEVHNQTNKLVRIRRLGPYLSQRRFRFRRGSPSTQLLVDQLRDFPLGAHDDGPDALEMALRLAEDVWQGRRATREDGLGDRLTTGS
ncbi:MAG: hypothetical protein AAGJ46_07745 [Planctomycetota bacterium]